MQLYFYGSTHKRNGRNGFCRATATAVDHGPCVRAPSLFAARQDPTLSLLSQASLKLSLQTRRALLRSRAALTRANDDKVVVATASALSPASPLRMTRIFARPAFMSRGGGFLRSRRLLWGLAPPKAARQDPATRWCRLVVPPPPLPPQANQRWRDRWRMRGCVRCCRGGKGWMGARTHAHARVRARACSPCPPLEAGCQALAAAPWCPHRPRPSSSLKLLEARARAGVGRLYSRLSLSSPWSRRTSPTPWSRGAW